MMILIIVVAEQRFLGTPAATLASALQGWSFSWWYDFFFKHAHFHSMLRIQPFVFCGWRDVCTPKPAIDAADKTVVSAVIMIYVCTPTPTFTSTRAHRSSFAPALQQFEFTRAKYSHPIPHHPCSRSGVLQTQRLKTHFMRTESSKVLPFSLKQVRI